MFSGPHIKMAFSFTIISNVVIRKSLLKRVLDWKMTLMLHLGSVLLKELYNLDHKFKENWPKKGRTIKTSFLGTVIKILLGM